MLSKNRTTVHSLDTTNRPSTGITRLPLIPVDGDSSRNIVDNGPKIMLSGSGTNQLSGQPLTSLELLRQLEAFVRELFEITSTD